MHIFETHANQSPNYVKYGENSFVSHLIRIAV